VNGDRNTESVSLIPNRIEARIVNAQELPVGRTNAQPEIFEKFQPAGAAPDGVINLRDHLLAESDVIHFAAVELREDDEPVGIAFHRVADHGLEFLSPSAGEDYDFLNVHLVHRFHQLVRRDALADASRVIDVIVHVPDGEARSFDGVDGDVAHALWVIVAQEERGALGRAGLFAILDLLLLRHSVRGRAEECEKMTPENVSLDVKINRK
jgi:hypothetical protein